MEVWSGSINIDTSSDLKIKLVNSSQRRENILPKDFKLSFRSLVNPALIPLYARAGPSVELHSTSEDTTTWLKTRLLSGIWLDDNHEEDGEISGRLNTIQCPVGLLVSVDLQQTSQSYSSANNVSDLLVYGILSSSHHEARIHPPSPPDSSSLVGEANVHGQDAKVKRDLQIYAVPLAASYVHKVQDLPSPPLSTTEDVNISEKDAATTATFAHFLPDLRSPSPKRKRILSLFEGAAQHHRRVRQRGGEAVSQMMANSKPQTSQLSSTKVKRKTDESGSFALKTDLRRARSLSLGGSYLNIGTDEKNGRPGSSKDILSRRGLELKQQNSLRESIGSNAMHSQSALPSPIFDIESQIPSNNAGLNLETQQLSSSPRDAETVVARNKDLITRTILTCMRFYGYKRKATRSTRPSMTTEPSYESDNYLQSRQHPEDSNIPDYITNTTSEERRQSTSATATATASLAAEEEEFKMTYHATYRAATFALRRYLKITTETTVLSAKDHHNMLPPVLCKDIATNVVDGLLKLFCDDDLKPSPI